MNLLACSISDYALVAPKLHRFQVLDHQGHVLDRHGVSGEADSLSQRRFCGVDDSDELQPVPFWSIMCLIAFYLLYDLYGSATWK